MAELARYDLKNGCRHIIRRRDYIANANSGDLYARMELIRDSHNRLVERITKIGCVCIKQGAPRK